MLSQKVKDILKQQAELTKYGPIVDPDDRRKWEALEYQIADISHNICFGWDVRTRRTFPLI